MPVFSKFDIFLKSRYVKIIFVKDISTHFLIFFAVFWYSKVINTGLQGFENPEIMKMSSFEVQNNEIGSLLYQNEAAKINKAIKSII